MSALATTAGVPLVTDSHGGLRVRGTRVALDRIVVAFKSGAAAEQIAQQFPTVELRDVYLIIGHYLSYTDEIDAYLSQRQSELADEDFNFDIVRVHDVDLTSALPVAAS